MSYQARMTMPALIVTGRMGACGKTKRTGSESGRPSSGTMGSKSWPSAPRPCIQITAARGAGAVSISMASSSSAMSSQTSLTEKSWQAAQKGPAARRRPRAAREAYSLYVERAAEGANEADGPFSAACSALVPDVVDEDVLAEAVGRGEEGAAMVDARHLLHEGHQGAALLQHEGVDGDALARAALRFLERLLEGESDGRVGELRLATFHVGGGLAVGDHDDLLVRPLVAPEELPRELEAVVHVGADVPLAPRETGELLRGELARVEREAEDVERVARELAAQERVQGQGHLLG